MRLHEAPMLGILTPRDLRDVVAFEAHKEQGGEDKRALIIAKRPGALQNASAHFDICQTSSNPRLPIRPRVQIGGLREHSRAA